MSSNSIEAAIGLMEKAWTMRREASSESEEELKRIYHDVHQSLTEAVAICRDAGAKRELVDALRRLGHVEQDMGNNAKTRELYEEAVNVAREIGDAMLLAHTVRHKGDIHRRLNRPEEAEPCYDEALALYRSQDQPPKLDFANALFQTAILKTDGGNIKEARQLFREARDLYQAVGIQEGVDGCSDHLAALGG